MPLFLVPFDRGKCTFGCSHLSLTRIQFISPKATKGVSYIELKILENYSAKCDCQFTKEIAAKIIMEQRRLCMYIYFYIYLYERIYLYRIIYLEYPVVFSIEFNCGRAKSTENSLKIKMF